MMKINVLNKSYKPLGVRYLRGHVGIKGDTLTHMEYKDGHLIITTYKYVPPGLHVEGA